jgi:hypothetical protein
MQPHLFQNIHHMLTTLLPHVVHEEHVCLSLFLNYYLHAFYTWCPHVHHAHALPLPYVHLTYTMLVTCCYHAYFYYIYDS